ncbi:hypothetical protein N431DRAFT_517583 [Stipitochalara longipes BDJ]|nr:hypothetical protein N431DRAFT_517583 [Stipitochalara longipes BDJ]
MTDRNVTPSACLLKQIFGNGQPSSTSILLQNWDKCSFRANFSSGRPSLVGRLEAEGTQAGTFMAIAALQEVARAVIPELKFQYSVIGLVEGETLEEAWERMDTQDRVSVVAEIASAIAKLHIVRSTAGCWGPSTAFLINGTALLNVILERRKLKKSFCSINPQNQRQGTRIDSNFEELGSVTIDESEMSARAKEAVLCHKDLTPRSIIIRSSLDQNGELSGFYPASYELSLQDTYLSTANQDISLYLILKEHMAKPVPRSSLQVVLLRAMELIYQSQQKFQFEGTNIPAHIRKRFLETGRLVRDKDPYLGWTRKDGKVVEIDKATSQGLEDQVIEEMLAKRRGGI